MHLLNIKVSEFSLFPMPSVFNFISNSRNPPHLRASIRISSAVNKLRCLTLSTSAVAARVSLSDSRNEQSCRLAPESVNTPEKPDALLAFLRELGFSETQISKVVISRPRVPRNADDYKKILEVVKEMGINPSSRTFLRAFRMMISIKKSTWDGKVQLFKKYGWSDREVLLALKKYPPFFRTSVDKIMAVMDFLVSRMGVDAATLADCPTIFVLSLERRIVPRCLIYQALLEKGCIKGRKLKLTTLLTISKKYFLMRIIKPYEDEAPEIVPLYEEMS